MEGRLHPSFPVLQQGVGKVSQMDYQTKRAHKNKPPLLRRLLTNHTRAFAANER